MNTTQKLISFFVIYVFSMPLLAESIICPLPSCDLVSLPFGPLKKAGGLIHFHAGVNFAVRRNTAVVAVSDGIVIKTGDRGSFGLSITIKHDNGFESLYAYLSTIVVKKNQRVKQGDNIALSGVSGVARGPTLHFRLKQEGQGVELLELVDGKMIMTLDFKSESENVDPLLYINQGD